jgi:excisionase family DNA binding protein
MALFFLFFDGMKDSIDKLFDALREIVEEAAGAGAARAIAEFRKEKAEQTLTADEVAQLLQIDKKTVYDQAASGELPAHRNGRSIFFIWSEILESTKIESDKRQDRVRRSA